MGYCRHHLSFRCFAFAVYLFDSDLESQQAVKNSTDKAQEEYNVALENARIHQEAFRNTFCLNLDVCPIAVARIGELVPWGAFSPHERHIAAQ